MKTLICTVGLPGAGKSILVKAARELGIPVYIMGDIIREAAKAEYGKDDAHHTGLFMKEIRRKFGRDIVARLTIDKIKDRKEDSMYILIDGLRNIEELEYFRGTGHRVVLIAVIARFQTRFKRIITRKRRDDIKTLSEFISRENRERDIGLIDVIREADYYFINEEITVEEGIEEAKKLLKLIMEDVN